MNKLKLKADKRSISGRKVKTLRKVGLLPANIFGKNVESLAIQLSKDEFQKVYKEAGETGLIEIDVNDDKKNVLVSNLQYNPLTEEILHIDFRQVSLKEKITAHVPVELLGESEAVKQGLGTLILQLDEVEVEALPTDFPEKFELSIEGLAEVDQALFVKDIKFDSDKVTMLTDGEEIIAKVEPLQKVEEVVVATEEVPTEGETPTDATTDATTSTEEGEKASE